MELSFTLRYRPLDHADIAAISRVHRRACLVAYAFMNWSYSEQEVRDWYVEKISDWDWGLVSEDEGVVGFVATAGARLDQLFVEPAHQGRGIGTRLLTTALARMPPSDSMHRPRPDNASDIALKAQPVWLEPRAPGGRRRSAA